MNVSHGDNVINGEAPAHQQGNRFQRHNPEQIQKLEDFFKEGPYISEDAIIRRSGDIGLNPEQIRFWIQNKRSQNKKKTIREDNDFLRFENQCFRTEISVIKELVSKRACPTCIVGLKHENAQLQQQLNQAMAFLENNMPRAGAVENGRNILDLNKMPASEDRTSEELPGTFGDGENVATPMPVLGPSTSPEHQ